MPGSQRWFLAGLFGTTLATLSLEILNTRLLSVVTWYHLSFFAVSTAMFGMAAGAVRVYLGGAAFEGERARRALARFGTGFALSIPASHLVNLSVPIPREITATTVGALLVSTSALAVPFYLSGVLVTIALTRVPGPTGLIYAVDLVGAAAGSLAVLALIDGLDVSSAALVCGAAAAGAAVCFHRFAGTPGLRRAGALAVALVAVAAVNAASPRYGLRVVHFKGGDLPRSEILLEDWSPHGHVRVREPRVGLPFFWGPGRGAFEHRVMRINMVIDGSAATVMTRWDGDLGSLDWVKHDVTALPYWLRRGGDVAVVGVGGGRDLLTALWARSRSVTAIEINDTFVELLEGRLRDFARLAERPELRLVHDEARSFLTRTEDRYDVVQMSLIDTWAATGAGAFTLSENGLYTVEAFEVFLEALAPGGLFSVSRWYDREFPAETGRLLSLATAALLERGVADPAAHMALVARGPVATLLLSNRPLPPRDLRQIERVAEALELRILLQPDEPPTVALLGRIATSGSRAELDARVADRAFDFSPPTDRRPFFFNLLRPSGLFSGAWLDSNPSAVVAGNLSATATLSILWLVSALLVGAVILGPLVRAGLPDLERRGFAWAVAYFALIGAGFMLVQIPLMQRFAVYLGHPTYAVSVVLFSMILAAGAGSWLSDRIPAETRPAWLWAGPPAIGILLVVATLAIQPLFDHTLQRGFPVRAALSAALVGVAALPLGTCFPVGLRLVRRVSPDATAWMWGVNGACSVLAAVTAVAVSMWAGIHKNLFAAAGCYALLALPALALWRRGAGRRSGPGGARP